MNVKGFSLLELLIAFALAGIILVAVLTLTLNLFTSNTRLRQVDTLEQTKNDIVVELTNSLRWAKKIENTTTTFTITDPDDKKTTYEFSGDTFYKDGKRFSSDSVLVSGVKIQDVKSDLRAPLFEISMDLSDKSFPTVTQRTRFVVAQRVGVISGK